MIYRTFGKTGWRVSVVVIPGATKVEQVIGNARAGANLLDEDLYRKLGAIA